MLRLGLVESWIFGLWVLTVAVATASNATGNIGPGAVSGLFVEVQPSHAVHLQLFAVDAAVENVADRGIRMGEESILAGTELRGSLGFLCNGEFGIKMAPRFQNVCKSTYEVPNGLHSQR